MLQTGNYLPCPCLLIKLDLFLVLKHLEKFNHFLIQRINRIKRLFVHQCIWCECALLTTVFPPSRMHTQVKNFWRQAAFKKFSYYEFSFSFKFFPCFFSIYSSAALGFYFHNKTSPTRTKIYVVTAAILKTWSVHRQRIKTASFFSEMLYRNYGSESF